MNKAEKRLIDYLEKVNTVSEAITIDEMLEWLTRAHTINHYDSSKDQDASHERDVTVRRAICAILEQHKREGEWERLLDIGKAELTIVREFMERITVREKTRGWGWFLAAQEELAEMERNANTPKDEQLPITSQGEPQQ